MVDTMKDGWGRCIGQDAEDCVRVATFMNNFVFVCSSGFIYYV